MGRCLRRELAAAGVVVVAAVAAVEVAMGLVERAKMVGTEVGLVPLVVAAAEVA